MIRMKRTGADVEAYFRAIAFKVREETDLEMEEAAKRVEKLARLMAPVDLGFLEASIKAEKAQKGLMSGTRVTVVAGGPVSLGDAGGRQMYRNVSRYAALIHENYEQVTAKHGPGPGTRAKMRRNPTIKIGSRFLTRALEVERKTIGQRMSQVITKIIKRKLPKGE